MYDLNFESVDTFTIIYPGHVNFAFVTVIILK